jgi:hypothetical protein
MFAPISFGHRTFTGNAYITDLIEGGEGVSAALTAGGIILAAGAGAVGMDYVINLAHAEAIKQTAATTAEGSPIRTFHPDS